MDKDGVVSECWFLDVGQGSANVILLGGGRAIVVDAGPRSSHTPIWLLRRYVTTIEALLISHNDADHDGGTARILEAYPRAIERIYFLADRRANQIRTCRLAMEEQAAGRLLRPPQRLEAREKPQVVYADLARDLELAVLYPTFLDSLCAENRGTQRPNVTSAVLVLRCGDRSVVYGGDAMMPSWEALARRLPDRIPLPCDVLTVPHHGGHLSLRRAGETLGSFRIRERQELRKLYADIVNPSVAVVSVGTSNQHDHPLSEVIQALRAAGVRVLCTQITPQCAIGLEGIRPGIVKPRWPSQSSVDGRFTASGRSKDVACAGTVVAEVLSTAVTISGVGDHERALWQAVSANRVSADCLARTTGTH